jgi:plastocyanin
MRGKLQRGAAFRRALLSAGLALAGMGAAWTRAVVAGRMTIMDKGDRPAEDVGQAVIWLTGPDAPAPAPVEAEITTSKKELSPHVLVVPVGSTVSFPNHDPFNHNVFSLSEENPFDLGLYGRGETR